MTETTTGKYFVYELSVTEHGDDVFYVGKGSGVRLSSHISEAMRGHCCPKCAVIRTLKQRKRGHWETILMRTDDEAYAYWYEMKIITSYPYGSLCNLTGGMTPPVICKITDCAPGILGEIYKNQKPVYTANHYDRSVVEQALRSQYDHLVAPYYLKPDPPKRRRNVAVNVADPSPGGV